MARATAQKIAPRKGINMEKKSRLTKARKSKKERNSRLCCIVMYPQKIIYSVHSILQFKNNTYRLQKK